MIYKCNHPSLERDFGAKVTEEKLIQAFLEGNENDVNWAKEQIQILVERNELEVTQETENANKITKNRDKSNETE